ncbi:hypothetical protein M8C21_016240 [Ambrosia artemisiifolia]|uniref:Uncharacterized protein n=1 Tax=Ambrosia artemisiifolia TaxID=4212 RepID=A0AAD5CQK7_AMBAR|nr:hypothetical protein M8C21_016240 [Ambrosia artemisiifolia]
MNERLLNEASKVRPDSSYFGGLKKNERLLNEACEVRPDSNYFVSLKKEERLLNEADKVRQHSNQFGGLEKNVSGPSSSKIIASAQVKNGGYNSRNLSTASNVVVSSGQSSSIATDKHSAKMVIDNSLEKKEHIKNETQLDGNIREIENAKSEIQSLVKLNLKLLSKEKKLEANVFKEVARHATHSIMAACGIEAPKARFRSFGRLDVVTTIADDATTACKA